MLWCIDNALRCVLVAMITIDGKGVVFDAVGC